MKKLALSLVAILLATPAFAQTLEVSEAVRHDVSRALWDMHIPRLPPGLAREAPEPKRLHGVPDNVAVGAPDPALQSTSLAASVALTTPTSFDGVGMGNYTVQYAPPDTNGAVGSTQYVQWVNVDFAVFNKSDGSMVAGFPKAGNTIWSGFGGYCGRWV